jgi:hypothetical protein
VIDARQRRLGFLVAGCMFMEILDGTIVSTAAPRIGAAPDELALGVLAALQGGLLLTQTRRETAPLEVALDNMIDRIRSFAP